MAPDRIGLDRGARGSFLGWPQNVGPRPDLLYSPDREQEVFQSARESLATVPGRRKLWEFSTHLHCSIIGTCLSTVELRQILTKLGHNQAATASEHDLHASGVVIAGQRHGGSKLLHKALDRRHRVSINQFDKAKTAKEVRTAWNEAAQRGDISGAYWAALSHSATNEALLREIFADVHMLSHLVGAANRADIRRLRQLEDANAELEAKIARQQQQLRDTIVSRDATIRDLQRTLEERIVNDRSNAARLSAEPDLRIWVNLIADLKQRLATVESRYERVEHELKECRSSLQAERVAHAETKKRDTELRQECEELETSLADLAEVNDVTKQSLRLSNFTLLYVGGRHAQIGHLRALAERFGALFLHHDGGIEERGGLLQGLISRADAVLFPVNCISHAAMSQVKRACLQSGKPFLPLRGAGLAPFWAALNNPTVLVSPALPPEGA